MKLLQKKGFWLCLALSLFFLPNTIHASTYGSTVPDPYDPALDTNWKTFGPNTDGLYYYYGDADLPKGESNGIAIDLEEESVSYQSIRAVITLPVGLIEHRGIETFHVLVNGNKKVDEFDVHYSNWEEDAKRYYLVTINVSDDYISSNMYFQVIGTALVPDGEYVVAWSNVTAPIDFKDMPVVDREAVSWLEKIHLKLDELLNALTAKLNEIKESIEKIYTVTPETQTKFDNALENLKSKMPSEQMKNQLDQVTDMMNQSEQTILNTPQKLEFGQINWMGATTTAALDLTEYEEQLKKLRDIMTIMLWVEFFYFVIRIVTPKFTV